MRLTKEGKEKIAARNEQMYNAFLRAEKRGDKNRIINELAQKYGLSTAGVRQAIAKYKRENDL